MSNQLHALLGALAISSALVVGCSLVYSSDLSAARSFDSVTGPGSDGGPSHDGSSGNTDGSGGGGDAQNPTKTRGCAAYQPTPKFCKDFDDNANLLGINGWDKLVEEGGKVTHDATMGYSGTGSAKVNMIAAGSCTYTRLERGFPNVGSNRIGVHMRMRPSSPWNRSLTPLILNLKPGGGQYCSPLIYADADNNGIINSSKVNVQSGNPQNDDVRDLDGFPPVNEWTDVGVDLVPAASGNGTTITFSYVRENGTKTERSHDFAQCKLGGFLFVAPGFHCDSGTAEVRYDDIRVDWE